MGTVRSTREGAVTTVRLDRPEAMNALDDDAKIQLLQALREAADDPAVRAVVLTGTGRAFCVGQDLGQHAEALHRADGFELGDTVRDHYNPIALLLSTMPKPVVAAVNGVAAGAGVSFALACDLRLMAQGAGLNTAFAAIGLSCDSGASWWLPRLVGMAKARELLMLPRTVRADEAMTLGLATRVVPDDELPDAAAELAARLAAGPTQAYAAIKSALLYSQGHDLADSLAHEAVLMGSTGGTGDHRGAVDAFLAKRAATFEGR